MPIRVLAPEIASQIAAGEVIERPASVIKELIENSLDAGAARIAIRIEGAGKRLMEVNDDGSGIPPDELPLAVTRHATSKLAKVQDLFDIETLGFRGEALASIGSVSRTIITSRPLNSETAYRLIVDVGKSSQVEPVGAPQGTSVQVENLFFNVPARLKFLKSDTTERRHIDTLVTRYALAYPQVRWSLHQEGKPALQTSGNGSRREVLGALYGAEIARQMLEVIAQSDGLKISGFISPPGITRSNRREIIFFVNGRPVHDPALTTALLNAYRNQLMVGRYPLGVIFLEMPAENVDVNVHPTKAEVRFRDPRGMFTGIQSAVRRALLAHAPVQGLEEPSRWAQQAWNAPAPHRDLSWDFLEKDVPPIEDPSSEDLGSQQDVSVDNEKRLESIRTPILRLVGQIAASYLVAEGPDGLYLIDQHAAHERILFEKMMASFEEISLAGKGFSSQALLQPETVQLPPASSRLIEEQMELLAELGFDIELFGPNTFLVRSIPSLLTRLDPGAALRALVEDFEENEAPLQDETEARIIARICKRAAVKAGQLLSSEEQAALITDLEACDSPRTCPHGRPTMIHISVDLLERQFGRRGAR